MWPPENFIVKDGRLRGRTRRVYSGIDDALGVGHQGSGLASLSAAPPLVMTGPTTAPVINLPAATTTTAGAMSGADKARLDLLDPSLFGLTYATQATLLDISSVLNNTGKAPGKRVVVTDRDNVIVTAMGALRTHPWAHSDGLYVLTPA